MKKKTKTNADRIREMSDEDMPGCEECLLAWLRSPAEESDG